MKPWTEFISDSEKAIAVLYERIEGAEDLNIHALDPASTVLIVVDMINGFAKSGALYSPRVEALIPEVLKLCTYFHKNQMAQLAFADAHTERSPEFSAYPPHCIHGTEESNLVPELAAVPSLRVIHKNSTNGYLEPEFRHWLAANEQIENFVLVGDCTDICVEQLANTLKCHFNRIDRPVRVIVPCKMVNTYSFGTHEGDLMHLMALAIMEGNGVEIVGGIAYESL